MPSGVIRESALAPALINLEKFESRTGQYADYTAASFDPTVEGGRGANGLLQGTKGGTRTPTVPTRRVAPDSRFGFTGNLISYDCKT